MSHREYVIGYVVGGVCRNQNLPPERWKGKGEEHVANELSPSSIGDSGGADPEYEKYYSSGGKEEPKGEKNNPVIPEGIREDMKKLQEKLAGEIAAENFEVTDFAIPAADRKLLIGRTEEKALEEYYDVAENIFFDLRDKAFVTSHMRRVIPRGKEREWMSDGLLHVVQEIERHWERTDVPFPCQDFDWMVILKQVKLLLEVNGITAPLEMINEDLFVVEGRVNKIRFTLPASKR